LLERFRAKAHPALEAGWVPVRAKKTRQNKEKRTSIPDSIGTEKGMESRSTELNLIQTEALLFERGLRANASRLSEEKTAPISGSCFLTLRYAWL
jgi:hypothetical protein